MKKNHFAMEGGILNFISFCVDSMGFTLNEKKLYCYTQSRAPGCMNSCAASDGGG